MKGNLKLCLLLLIACLSWSNAMAATAEEVMQQLRDGNERFVNGGSLNPNADIERVLETSAGQHPIATILGCSDSRVPIEIVMDQGIGDLFIVRTAGNVAAVDELGSIEYGVHHLHTPLLVVLGHTHCGACTAVVEGAQLSGNIPALVKPIEEAVSDMREENPGLSGDVLIAEVVIDNIWESTEDVFASSEASAELVRSGELMIVGALYDIETGKISWLGEHEDQEALLAD